jgi:hypothetical protein
MTWPTDINVKDAEGVTRAIYPPNANGRAGEEASRPVVLSTEDKAALDGINTNADRTADAVEAILADTTPVVVRQDSSSISDNGAALTPKFAVIAASSAGATAVVAAVTGKKVRVLSYALLAAADVNVKWQSAASDRSGLLYLAARGGVSVPHSPVGHFETAAGEALNVNLSGAVAVGGHLTYVEV